MDMVNKAHPNIIAWLQELLRSRIHPDISVDSDSHDWILRMKGTPQQLLIRSQWEQWNNDHVPDAARWINDVEGLSAPLADTIPAPYLGENACFCDKSSRFGYDFLSYIWWMLSRKEECCSTVRDSHGRFPATASHAYKNGYLFRPVADEWIEILRQLTVRVWPDISLRTFEYAVRPSHDVDVPLRFAATGAARFVRAVAGELIRNKALITVLKSPYYNWRARKGWQCGDPFDTYSALMTASERLGVKSTFYFKSDYSNSRYDCRYSLRHPRIRSIVKEIRERGHLLGFHPSYESAFNAHQFSKELAEFRSTLEISGPTRLRMHYLRWDVYSSLKMFGLHDVQEDSTLGYADSVGFRCGTCHPYVGFDPVNMLSSSTVITPLIFMEGSVFSPQYMGRESDFMDLAIELSANCKAVKGTFGYLWHNNNTPERFKLYPQFIEAIQ